MAKDVQSIVRNEQVEIVKFETEPYGTNAYIVSCQKSNANILIDAPGSAGQLIGRLREGNTKMIVITHGHMDHVMALEEIVKELSLPVAVHSGDAAILPLKADRLLKEGDSIELGSLGLQVIHTPGHTEGSICLLLDGYLLAGDTIFPGGPGKTGSPRDFARITASLQEKIFSLPGQTLILPGHGDSGLVETEKAAFEAFMQKGFPEGLCGDVSWG